MPSRPALGAWTAGLAVAAIAWSAWAFREPPRPLAAPAAAPPREPAPPAAAEERPERQARHESFHARLKALSPSEDRNREILAFVRDALKQDPHDSTALTLLFQLPPETGGDVLLELAGDPTLPKETRQDAFKLLGQLGYTEELIRKAAIRFDVERDDDLRVALLLGMSDSPLPAAADLARKALAEPQEAVRAVAMAALRPDRDVDRRLLIGLATSDPSDHLRGTAALQLNERSADADVRAALVAMLLRDASEENRKAAVTVLKREARRADVLDALRAAAANDRSAEVRAQARAALGD